MTGDRIIESSSGNGVLIIPNTSIILMSRWKIWSKKKEEAKDAVLDYVSLQNAFDALQNKHLRFVDETTDYSGQMQLKILALEAIIAEIEVNRAKGEVASSSANDENTVPNSSEGNSSPMKEIYAREGTKASVWPALTLRGARCLNCLKRYAGEFCHQHIKYQSEKSIAVSPKKERIDPRNEDASMASTQRWPALTKNGTDCKNCLRLGIHIFCPQHSEFKWIERTAPSSTIRNDSGPLWPALTARKQSCKLCLVLGAGTFCPHHRPKSV